MRDLLLLTIAFGGVVSLLAGPVSLVICFKKHEEGKLSFGLKQRIGLLVIYVALLIWNLLILFYGLGVPASDTPHQFDVLFFGSGLLFFAYSMLLVFLANKSIKNV